MNLLQLDSALQAYLTIIAICTALGLTVILWVIIGMPWKKAKPSKPWTTPPAADIRLARDWELDEHETKIS